MSNYIRWAILTEAGDEIETESGPAILQEYTMGLPTVSLLPNARVQFIDANGKPYAGGTVEFYIPGGFTPKDTWQDAFQNAANENPLTLDAQGTAAIWGTGFYRQILKDALGNTIWDQDTLAPQLGAGAGELFFDTIADARLAIIAEGTPSLTLVGYNHPGDAGGGIYLPATPGAGVGKFQSADGAWWKLGSLVYNKGPLAPEQFGAVGDGATADDMAFAALIATGLPIQGSPGSTYGLASPLVISSVANFSMSNCTLKDLTPGSSTRKFLYGLNNTSVRMSKVSVLRNGTGGGGSLGGNSAIWIEGASFFDLTDIEVSGNDAGSGIRLVSCLHGGTLTRAFVHDMLQGTPSSPNPGDGADQIIGIWEIGCIGLTIESPVVRDLLTQCVDYTPKNINTRGITTGGTGSATTANMVSISNGFVANVDEGYDYTGDQYPIGMQTTNCRAEYCRKFGFKCAGTVLSSIYTNCYAYRCTLDGFYMQGGSMGTTQTHTIDLIGCISEAAGYNVATYYTSGTTTAGFRCDYGSADMTHPRNVRFINCTARGGTEMKFGFINSIGAGYQAQDRNRIINCTALDWTEGSQDGFVDAFSFLGLQADQVIPNNTQTTLVFDRAHDGIDGFHFLPGTGSDRTPTSDLVFQYNCRVQITCSIPFYPSTTGIRALQMNLNGGSFAPTRDIRNASTESETTPMFTVIRDIIAGDVMNIVVQQTSGGDLSVNAGDLGLFVVDLNSPPQIIISY